MKAKEYFEKYDERVLNDGTDLKYTIELLIALCDEVSVIQKQRNARRNESFCAIIRETNQKWNAICNLYKKKYGMSPLAENAFKEFWIRKIPEIAKFL